MAGLCANNVHQSNDSEETTDVESKTEPHRKQSFRQFIRSLREDRSNDSGPLLASSEDQVDAEDDDGFIVAHKHRKHRKSKSLAQDNERNICKDVKLSCNNADDRSEVKNLPEKMVENSGSSFKFEKPTQELKTETNSISPKNTSRKQAWVNTTRTKLTKIIDSSECPICLRPWLDNKIVLEECGHCFHAECVRLWMRQKKTCPFCAGYSLLPEEFPRLS